MNADDARVLDAFKEIMSIGVGKAASIMNTMLSNHVTLSVPMISLLSVEEFNKATFFPKNISYSAVEMKYSGFFDGVVDLIFDTVSAGKLVDSLADEDTKSTDDFDSLRAGTLCEIGNIVINGVLGTMANILDVHLNFSVPFYHEGAGMELFRENSMDENSMVLLTKATFDIKELSITGDLAMFFSFASFANIRPILLSLGQS